MFNVLKKKNGEQEKTANDKDLKKEKNYSEKKDKSDMKDNVEISLVAENTSIIPKEYKIDGMLNFVKYQPEYSHHIIETTKSDEDNQGQLDGKIELVTRLYQDELEIQKVYHKRIYDLRKISNDRQIKECEINIERLERYKESLRNELKELGVKEDPKPTEESKVSNARR